MQGKHETCCENIFEDEYTIIGQIFTENTTIQKWITIFKQKFTKNALQRLNQEKS